MLTRRIAELRSQINKAEAQHATSERLGELWIALANTYQSRFDLVPAEDAFAHALRLLRGTGAQAQYADALDGMGSLYMATGRPQDAKQFLSRSAEIYGLIVDSRHEAAVRVRCAIALQMDRKFREAETESTNALKYFESAEKPNVTDVTMAYLTRSYAESAQRRYKEALQDVDRASAVAQAGLPENSIEMVTASLARGVDLWKSGDVENAGRAMREALRMVRLRSDLPTVVYVDAQLVVLRRYEAFLKGTHQKTQAKELELGLTRLEEERTAGCSGCTVSAAAFRPGLLLP